MPPGKEGKIELKVEHTEGYAGEVSKAATVTTNDPKFANFTLTLRARFISDAPAMPAPPTVSKRATVFVEPTDRIITSVLTGNTTSSSLYVINSEAKPVHVKSVEAGGTTFTATLSPIQDGQRYEIAVKSAANLKPGTYQQTLRVLTDSTTTPVVPVQMTLTVYARIFSSPTAIIMPPLPINTELSTISWPAITIRKVQSGGLEIKRVSSSLAFLDLTTETQKAGEVYQIHVKLNDKVKAGEFKGTIRVETNDADMPVIEVPVQVSFK
ncbi:MAG TPA: hypothetical protein VJZ91_06890 [Blastocatellia bacterium]|nr:hypothetical protein [Blastocatellia bacterium]